MTALELQLRALGHELDVPPERDLAPVVLDQLSLSGTRPFPWRRAAALAFAVLAIAVAAAFAVPQARTAILRFFHIGGETILRVETLPPAVERAQAGGLGTSLSRVEAERRLGFQLVLPRFNGDQPDRVYVLGDSVGTVIVRSHGRPVLLSEFSSPGEMGLKKLTLGTTTVQWVRVNGGDAIWIQGGTHTLTYFDRQLTFQQKTIRIHGNVLVWVRGRTTLRLEGDLTRAQAIALARTIR
jgi:hypothetical protein